MMTNKWTPVLTNSQESSVGVMNFDGAGNVTWTANAYNTKANPHHQTITFQGPTPAILMAQERLL